MPSMLSIVSLDRMLLWLRRLDALLRIKSATSLCQFNRAHPIGNYFVDA
jgi:hypothetical protein